MSRKSYVLAGLVLAFTICLVGCNGSPSSPGPVDPPTPVPSAPEWAIPGFEAAKGRFFARGNTCVGGKEAAAITWLLVDGAFECGATEVAAGCFWTESHHPYIRISQTWLSVDLVAHEASHYLLWACGDPNWACYVYEQDNYLHPGCLNGIPVSSMLEMIQ